jgi:hypothetical protein
LEIKIYKIEEDVRPAEVAIDFGLSPVVLSSIGRWCPPLQAEWILSLELERLRTPPKCGILSSETRNIISTVCADALSMLACVSLVCGIAIRRSPYRQLV